MQSLNWKICFNTKIARNTSVTTGGKLPQLSLTTISKFCLFIQLTSEENYFENHRRGTDDVY